MNALQLMLARMFRFAFLISLFALPVAAEDLCRADINSTELLIDRDALGTKPGTTTLRERATGWPARGLNRLRGRLPICDSGTLFSFLSNEAPAEDVAGYCLSPDPTLGYVLVPGERDYRGRCARTTCERVAAVGNGAASVAGRATDLATGRRADQSRADAVVHSSGAAILTGSATSVLAALGSGASSAMTMALAAPAVAGAAAVSVVAVGGAVYLCRAD